MFETSSANADPMVDGRIVFSQLPHQAVQVKGLFDDSTATTPATKKYGNPEREYKFMISTYGNIGVIGDACSVDVSDIGVEFNPLREEKNGVVNPYADARRGRIDSQTAPIAAINAWNWEQTDLLQNLAGPDSIIGRGIIAMYEMTPGSGDFDAEAACCIIRVNSVPAEEPVPSSIWLRPRVSASTGHGHHYNAYPSHNSYGNYGHH